MSYYRDAPGYGTQQFTFAPPPQPAYRPEPSWGGRDYYNAAAISPDPTLYDAALSRVRSGAQLGVGFHEARHWHRRAYGGLADFSQMQPSELGAAAGYEAYRSWIHNSSMYEPIQFDDDRQREVMIGLAVAEVTRLWHSSGRRMDRYGLQAACEAAAATASIIMGQWNENEYSGSPPSQGSGFGAPYGTPAPGAPYGAPAPAAPFGAPYGAPLPQQADPYAYDNVVHPRRSHRHRRRASSISPPTIINVGGGGSGGAQPYYGGGASSGVNIPPYGGTRVSPMMPTVGMPGSAPASSVLGGGQQYGSPGYGGGGGYGVPQPVTMVGGGGGGGYGVPQATVIGGPMQGAYPPAYAGGLPPNSIVIPAPERRRHRSRSRARDRDDDRDRDRDRDRDERRRERRSRRYSDIGPVAMVGGSGVGGTRYGGGGYGVPTTVVGGTAYRY